MIPRSALIVPSLQQSARRFVNAPDGWTTLDVIWREGRTHSDAETFFPQSCPHCREVSPNKPRLHRWVGAPTSTEVKTETMMPQIEFPSQLQFSLGGASAQCVRACSGEGEGERERGRLSLGRLRLRQLLLRHFEFTQ